jgi:SAM-dependent methyltransferase
MSAAVSALDVAKMAIGDEHHPVEELQLPQTVQRFAIAEAWNTVKPGDRILEIGCGQGDMTAVLAALVGSTGHIAALDPADPAAYGSPWTLKQAQEHLSRTSIGDRIEWIRADTVEYLDNSSAEGRRFDAVVLAHSLWYFPSPQAIDNTLAAIKRLAYSPKLLIAEYALGISHPEATPHLLSVLAQAALEAHKPISTSNVRTVISPNSLRIQAQLAGWKPISGQSITPAAEYQDGRWEVGMVISKRFLEEISQVSMTERERSVIIAMRDAVIFNAARFDRKSLRSMDVWVAAFE